MNAAYPGDPASNVPELRRASKVLEINNEYEYVCDMHTVGHGREKGVDCAFVDLRKSVSRKLLGLIAAAGIRSVVDFSKMNSMLAHTRRGVMFEVDPSGPLTRLSHWRGVFQSFVRGEIEPADPKDFAWYSFPGEAGDVKESLCRKHSLPEFLDGFERLRLPPGAAQELGLPEGPVHALLWSAVDDPEGYRGEVCVPISPPAL